MLNVLSRQIAADLSLEDKISVTLQEHRNDPTNGLPKIAPGVLEHWLSCARDQKALIERLRTEREEFRIALADLVAAIDVGREAIRLGASRVEPTRNLFSALARCDRVLS